MFYQHVGIAFTAPVYYLVKESFGNVNLKPHNNDNPYWDKLLKRHSCEFFVIPWCACFMRISEEIICGYFSAVNLQSFKEKIVLKICENKFL
jgi:hypothetical protein